MNWKFVTPPEDPGVFSSFEQEFGVKLPPELKELLSYANGGAPGKTAFTLPNGETCEIKNLYSINPNDMESMWDFNSRENLEEGYIVFAGDDFGNRLGIRMADGTVVFEDRDDEEVFDVESSLEDFLRRLEME